MSHTKIWIYQSSRQFSDTEASEIKQKAMEFIAQWQAHGSTLTSSMELMYNRFIVFSVNEQYVRASGCSIDSSIAFIKSLEQGYNIDLLDRMQVAFRNKEAIETLPLASFRELLKSGKIKDDTIVFNNLVTTKEEFDRAWEIPVKESWIP